jgi:hypothetical protein
MKAKLIEEANSMEPDPPRSKLDEYAEVIWELRRKRKRINSITQFLKQHGVSVGKSTVARWLKTHPVPQTAHSKSAQDSLITQSPEVVAKAKEFFTKQTKNHEPSRPYNIDP